MLGYQLRFRKGSFAFQETYLSRTMALSRATELMRHGAIYDVAIFSGDGKLLATDTEIANHNGRTTAWCELTPLPART